MTDGDAFSEYLTHVGSSPIAYRRSGRPSRWGEYPRNASRSVIRHRVTWLALVPALLGAVLTLLDRPSMDEGLLSTAVPTVPGSQPKTRPHTTQAAPPEPVSPPPPHRGVFVSRPGTPGTGRPPGPMFTYRPAVVACDPQARRRPAHRQHRRLYAPAQGSGLVPLFSILFFLGREKREKGPC